MLCKLSLERVVLMSDTRIVTTAKAVVEFDRASFLMDRELFQQSTDETRHERDPCPRHDATYSAQWVWAVYCERHRERYDEEFGPDVIEGWDQPAKPEPTPWSEEEAAEARKAIVPLTLERAAELG